MDTQCVISLERVADGEVLSYKTIVTNAKGVLIGNYKFETENYNQALLVAQLFYEEFQHRFPKLIIGSYVEQPYCLQHQGALYSASEFATPEVNMQSLYQTLKDDFVDKFNQDRLADINLVFRVVVANNKLNLYQERKFLEILRQEHIV